MAKKVSIIGAGAVGATLAQRVLESGLADVVLLDIAKDLARAKALDMADAAPIIGHERKIAGTDDYGSISSSDIVVITAGFPRKPGMTREDLISRNAAIVKEASQHIKQHAAGSIVIVVTNPLDMMTCLALKTTGFDRRKVFGMAGLLDSSRFVNLLADDLKVPRSTIETYVLGSHGDSMVALLSQTRVSGKSVSGLIPKERLDAIVKRTCDRGAEIVSLLGSGSAYYSPSAAVFRMIDIILNNKSETLVASAYLDGEYDLKGLCIGVPCRIGNNGIEEIVTVGMSGEERDAFRRSAESIRKTLTLL